jgi:glycosyltransferase involved in cell wall biosynthesis
LSLIALIQAKDEEVALPGWLANVGPWVDGVVALDDGSSDRTAEILRGHPKVVELIRRPAGAAWNERANQVALVEAGRRRGASWFVCLDADERVERSFGLRVHDLLAEAEGRGVGVLGFQLRELWGDRHHFRSDGLWNKKVVYRLFRNNPRHRRFDPRPMHRFWMPLELVPELSHEGRHGGFDLYHLKMITPAGRAARVARDEMLDPGNLYQRMGYRYLVDEGGLERTRIPDQRGFDPVPDPAASDA